jgi:hypothetical protein
MKRTTITIIAASGLAMGAFAQGTLFLQNDIAGGWVNDYWGGHYSGPLTVQVWVLPNASLNGTISSDLASAESMHAAVLAASPYGAPDVSVSGNTSSWTNGVFSFGQVALPHVALGASCNLALVMFTGSAWGIPGYPNEEGVIIFNNPTGGDGVPPSLPAALTGWDAAPLNSADLRLGVVTIPEPGTLALAGLGAAGMLIFRRRS